VRGVVALGSVVAAAIALAGCGGSGGPDSVNGCAIEPATSCSGVDLSGADLSGADLSRATLTGANLEGTNLSGADLTEANLGGARIVDADLSDADLTGATISGTSLDGATLCGTTRTNGTVDDSSCPPSTDTTATNTTPAETTTGAAPATVETFSVGDLACDGSPKGTVTVTWTTKDATAVEIAVDGDAPTGYAPSGSTDVDVPCDNGVQTVTITPQSDTGPGSSRKVDVPSSG
jgi:Pentapeptide repeats (8 copies)